MPNRFLITGLPRSRTAWMAQWMTFGDSVCLHEPRNWRDLWSSGGEGCVGISDCGLGFELLEILEEFSPQVLIIERPVSEVEESLAAMNTGLPMTNFCALLKQALDDAPADDRIMRINFHAMGDMRLMQKAFWHLMPGKPFDEGRFHDMKDTHIEINADELACNIKNPATHYKIPEGLAVQ